MTPEQRYELAYNTVYAALEPVAQKALRDLLAENVAAGVIGRGDWGAERYQRLASDETARQPVVRSAMRDLPETVIVSSGPVDAAVKAAAVALLAAEGPSS